jgi:hypothetical protein
MEAQTGILLVLCVIAAVTLVIEIVKLKRTD